MDFIRQIWPNLFGESRHLVFWVWVRVWVSPRVCVSVAACDIRLMTTIMYYSVDKIQPTAGDNSATTKTGKYTLLHSQRNTHLTNWLTTCPKQFQIQCILHSIGGATMHTDFLLSCNAHNSTIYAAIERKNKKIVFR